MKKVVLGLCAALIVAAMTSCGSKPSNGSVSTSEPSTTTPPSESSGGSTSVVRELREIEIGTYPKTQYEANEEFEVTNGVLTLIYSNGDEENIPMTLDMIVQVPDMTTPGSKRVDVTYLGFTTSYNIQVSVIKVDATFTWSFENNQTFVYDGTGTAPDISVTVNESGVQYETYFSKDEENIGTAIPTAPGTYSLVIQTVSNDYYNATHGWRNFKIINKAAPEITFNFEAGQNFVYDGTGEAPEISANVPNGVVYDWYFEHETRGNLGKTVPTEPDVYSLIIETEENDTYSATRVYRWFRIVAPTNKETPVVTFSFEVGQAFEYDGTGVAPDISVTVTDGVEYDWWFEKNEQSIGKVLPTEPGHYALVVQTVEDDNYVAYRTWRVFQITAPVTKQTPTVTFNFEAGQNFEYDGTGEAPEITATVSDGVVYDWYFEHETRGNLGKTVPTEPDVYSLIIETQENETYSATRVWRWFRIVAPTVKETPVVTFSFEPSEVFEYDGTGDAPDISVTVTDGVEYDWWFEKNEQSIGKNLPTEPGHYALVVQTVEDDNYVAYRTWRVFQITAPSNEVSLKKALPR